MLLLLLLLLGITKTVRRRMEVPKEVLDRILLEGEEVIGQYDYYFIKKRMHLSDVSIYITVIIFRYLFIFMYK